MSKERQKNAPTLEEMAENFLLEYTAEHDLRWTIIDSQVTAKIMAAFHRECEKEFGK